MKPYGQKQEKSHLSGHTSDQCDICSNRGWKVLKSRERASIHVELNSPLNFDDIEAMIVVETYKDDLFKAFYEPLGIEVVGMTPEHAIGKVHEAFQDFN
jgi:hypothetical protein